MLNVREIPQKLPQALGIDIDGLVKANPSIEHNLREEWNSAVTKVQEFCTKYGTTSTKQ